MVDGLSFSPFENTMISANQCVSACQSHESLYVLIPGYIGLVSEQNIETGVEIKGSHTVRPSIVNPMVWQARMRFKDVFCIVFFFIRECVETALVARVLVFADNYHLIGIAFTLQLAPLASKNI